MIVICSDSNGCDYFNCNHRKEHKAVFYTTQDCTQCRCLPKNSKCVPVPILSKEIRDELERICEW